MGRDPAERAPALASLARRPDLDRELGGTTGYRRGGGLLVAVGFSGHGFALASTVGDIIARLVLDRDPLLPLWKGLHVARTCLW